MQNISPWKVIQGSDIAWGTFLMPFLSESWVVVIVVLLLTAATVITPAMVRPSEDEELPSERSNTEKVI